MAEASKGNLLVGEHVVCKGHLKVPQQASIDGLVEGTLEASSVRIGAAGIVKGGIDAGTVQVAGMAVESVRADQVLVIEPTGWVRGSVKYRALEVRRGGQLLGDIRMLDGLDTPASAQKSRAARTEKKD